PIHQPLHTRTRKSRFTPSSSRRRGIGERRPVEAKSLGIMETFALHRHVGAESSEQCRELEPVRRAETHCDARMSGKSIHDEVSVRSQRVETALGPGRATGTG